MKMSKLGPKCQYFLWPPLFSSTALTLLGMELTTASQVATGVFFHSSMMTSRSWWILETLRSSTFHLRMPHRLPLPSGSFSKAVVFLEVCLGLLSCWNTALRPSLRRDHALLQYVTVHVGIHGSLNELPSAGSTHVAPEHDTPTTMLDCRQDTLVFVLLNWLPPHMLDII